jgi:hypothetical protein
MAEWQNEDEITTTFATLNTAKNEAYWAGYRDGYNMAMDKAIEALKNG